MRMKHFLPFMLVMTGAALIAADGVEMPANGIDLSGFDKSCEPCDDFFKYVNGTWVETSEIPAQYGSWSMIHLMYERNQKQLQAILEEAAAEKNAEKGSVTQKVGDFYNSGMDLERIEAEGLKPLAPLFERIDGIKNAADVARVIRQFHNDGLDMVFDLGVNQDLKENTRVIAYVSQGGLGLPNMEYYTKEDEESVKLREKYVSHVTNMFKLLGDDANTAAANAAKVLEIETRLAKVSLTPVESRDPNSSYNIVTPAEADAKTPNFSWGSFFGDLGLKDMKSFSMPHQKFFAEMNTLIGEIPAADWKTYFRWHLITNTAPYLTEDVSLESFEFFSKTLQGARQQQERWKRVQNAMNMALGEAVGQLYVKRHFTPESKARVLSMVGNMLEALKVRLADLDWMGEETKKQALAKFSTFTPKIGYPDKWRDYSKYEVVRGAYVTNILAAWKHNLGFHLNKIGKPVDRSEWFMTPQTINAYYNPTMNEIVFPAGILQPPVFNPAVDDAVNYGAMGAIIGHELMHGFDDSGSQFDKDGNLKNWWTDQDRKLFEERTAKLVAQYNEYEVAEGVNVNGELTLGENIGDLGGVIVAHMALENSLKGKPVKKIDGFTPQQRFFLSFAQVWRSKYRPEMIKLQVKTDTHSPNMFRAVGPLVNLQEFYDAFGCKEGDAMVRPKEKRVKIW